MKHFYFIFIFIMISCENKVAESPEYVIDPIDFEKILYEIHIAESQFELTRRNNLIQAKQYLDECYNKIYVDYNIKQQHLDSSIEYYGMHPHILDRMYSNILEDLKIRSSVDL